MVMRNPTLPDPTPLKSVTLNPMTLAGRVVLITGAGGGLGRATAELAAALGAFVAINDMDAAAARRTAAAIGGRARAYGGSIADPGAVAAMVAQVVADFGDLHGLVNNAGILRRSPLEHHVLTDWNAIMAVNVTGTFLCLQAAGRHFIAKAGLGDAAPGRVVNIASDGGRRGAPGATGYAASKAAVLGLTMSAAREWARYGITVNSVCFGRIETSINDYAREPGSEAAYRRYIQDVPLGRLAPPAEAVPAVCFLLSDAASYITGQSLSVNGGGTIAL